MSENNGVESYKDLLVWQKGMELLVEAYRITEELPKTELYGLASQIRRAAVSIPSNIAEGSRRSSRKDFRSFLYNAYGSGAELETQIEAIKRVGFVSMAEFVRIDKLLEEEMKMLNAFIHGMK